MTRQDDKQDIHHGTESRTFVEETQADERPQPVFEMLIESSDDKKSHKERVIQKANENREAYEKLQRRFERYQRLTIIVFVILFFRIFYAKCGKWFL